MATVGCRGRWTYILQDVNDKNEAWGNGSATLALRLGSGTSDSAADFLGAASGV